MAISPIVEYPSNMDPVSTPWPYGEPRNVSAPGAGDGTPWETDTMKDIMGFQQALLSEAGITPSGTAETATASQYLEAITALTTRTYESIEDIAGVAGTVSNQIIQILGRLPSTDKGGGFLYWDSAQVKSGHDGGVIFSPTVPWNATQATYNSGTGETDPSGSGCWIRIITTGSLSLADFGGIGASSEDALLLGACTAAAALGLNRVVIPFATLNVAALVDCQGCAVVGSGTVLTGVLGNFSEIPGLSIQGKKTIDRAWHPNTSRDNTMKLIGLPSTNVLETFVTRSGGEDHIRVEMVNNVTTTTDSLAATASDATMWRPVKVTDVLGVRVGLQTAYSSTGTWTPSALALDVPASYDGGVAYQIYTATGTSIYTTEVDLGYAEGGKIRITVIRTPTSTTDATILLNGNPYTGLANIDLSTSSGSVLTTYELDADQGGLNYVAIRNNIATLDINLVGVNYGHLENYNGEHIDTYAWYTLSTSIVTFLDNTEANGLAIRENVSSLWGCGYHGGETSVIQSIRYGDASTAGPTVGEFLADRYIAILGRCTVDWSGSGGPTVDVESLYEFVSGGYSERVTINNAVTATDIIFTQFGADETFDHVLAPVIADIGALTDGDREYYGLQNGYRVTESLATPPYYLDKEISITHSMWGNEGSEYGGAYTIRDAGTYHKYRYALVENGLKTVSGAFSTAIYSFR